mmetsp:Transcript_2326/g.7471  ORF Transcript_2326/g.7471 Transcript_2326/m.7471 type:complete len:238 (-) Transcript_2326:359-1072(-)|eukprot:scaffold58133_cov35-Tisochrysis_lutea.AAC.1
METASVGEEREEQLDDERMQSSGVLPSSIKAFEVDGAGEWQANGIYYRSNELYNGCPQWGKSGTRWRIYWPQSQGICGWILGEATEPCRSPYYACEIDFEMGRALGRWTTEAELIAWCEKGNGHVTELFTERWLCYRTGLLPPMFEGGQPPAPELFATEELQDSAGTRDATDETRAAAEDLASAATRDEGRLELGPPMDLIIPAAVVLGVCAIAFIAHFAGIVWEAMGLTGNARIEL